jgi:hypothetical protein
MGPPWDRWHDHQSILSGRFVEGLRSIRSPLVNIGCGRRRWDIPGLQIQLDVAIVPLRNEPTAAVASAENLPLRSGSVAAAVCIGSVLNYCDAVRVVCEAERVLARRGLLVLEFERSESAEYIGTPYYRRQAALASVLLQDRPHTVWLYSERYVSELLLAVGLRIRLRRRFHIASAVMNRLAGNQEKAAGWARWDRILSRIPFLRGVASNVILVCEKT